VLSGIGLCDVLIIRPEESYRLWCVVVCDLETSWMKKPWPTGGLWRQKQKQAYSKQSITLIKYRSSWDTKMEWILHCTTHSWRQWLYTDSKPWTTNTRDVTQSPPGQYFRSNIIDGRKTNWRKLRSNLPRPNISIVPGFSGDPPRHREHREAMQTTGKISQFEITVNSLSYWSQTTWWSPEQTHLHPVRCLDISESRG
jgi:hypothetical protein